MSQLQWMVIVDADADDDLVEMLNTKITAAVQVARDEHPTEMVKYAMVAFDEQEL